MNQIFQMDCFQTIIPVSDPSTTCSSATFLGLIMTDLCVLDWPSLLLHDADHEYMRTELYEGKKKHFVM